MRQTRPLPDTHPEFTILYWQGFTEYRVEHWRLARNGSGQIVRGTSAWSWVDVCSVLLAALVFSAWFEQVPIPVVLVVGLAITLTWLVRIRCTQVLHESLLVFPTLGIQLETHLGHPLLPSMFTRTTRRFVPLGALEDVVLHEGFKRWDVRYYLAVLYRRSRSPLGSLSIATASQPRSQAGFGSKGEVQVGVAFENILPYFPVLKLVYLGVQETLFPPPDLVVEETDG